jgi:hypothetical protein
MLNWRLYATPSEGAVRAARARLDCGPLLFSADPEHRAILEGVGAAVAAKEAVTAASEHERWIARERRERGGGEAAGEGGEVDGEVAADEEVADEEAAHAAEPAVPRLRGADGTMNDEAAMSRV